MTFGEKIKKARLALNLSQSEVAEKTGISERSLYTYEQTGTMPRSGNILKLAKRKRTQKKTSTMISLLRMPGTNTAARAQRKRPTSFPAPRRCLPAESWTIPPRIFFFNPLWKCIWNPKKRPEPNLPPNAPAKRKTGRKMAGQAADGRRCPHECHPFITYRKKQMR